MNETVYDIRLSLILGPNSGYYGLLKNYGSAEAIWRATDEELLLEGLPPKIYARLTDRDLHEAGRVADFCSRYGVKILIKGDRDYPRRLGEIHNPPYLLYVLGELPDFDRNPGIGIVGTRRMTDYGMKNAYKISYELASAGLTVVSGMARGIDGVAACGALEARGKTVAVIGTGLDTAYPSEHRQLMKEIAKEGAVISEFAPSSPPSAGHFPIRNRIISGLSEGLFVVEAGSKSGAMLTAFDARDEQRQIFALPGRITDSESEGPNSLLRDGALAATCAGDILAYYSEKFPGSVNTDMYSRSTADSDFRPSCLGRHGVFGSDGHLPAVPENDRPSPASEGLLPEDGRMQEIFILMPEGKAVSPDFFTSKGYSAAEAVNLLSLLEITGFIKSIPGGLYIK